MPKPTSRFSIENVDTAKPAEQNVISPSQRAPHAHSLQPFGTAPPAAPETAHAAAPASESPPHPIQQTAGTLRHATAQKGSAEIPQLFAPLPLFVFEQRPVINRLCPHLPLERLLFEIRFATAATAVESNPPLMNTTHSPSGSLSFTAAFKSSR